MSSAAITLGLAEGITPFLAAFARVSGVLHTAPVLSESAVPRPARVALAVLLAFLVVPHVTAAALPQLGPGLALVLVGELMLGVAMGLAPRLILVLVDVAGTVAGFSSGMAIATQFDPLTNSQAAVVTRLLQVGAVLLFLQLELHHIVLVGLADSFVVLPIGAGVPAARVGLMLHEVMARVFVDGVRIAMPVVAVGLFVNVMAALVTRFSQQMNIYFSAGLVMATTGGLLAIGLMIPALLVAVRNIGEGLPALLHALVGA